MIERDTGYSYNRVMNFLDGSGKSATKDKDVQRRTTTCFNGFCRDTVLPEGLLLFKSNGEMSLALSEKQLPVFKEVLLRRKAIVNNVCKEEDLVFENTPKPRVPAFVRELDFVTYRELEPDEEEVLLLLLDDEQKAQYGAYTLQYEFYNQAMVMATNALKSFKAEWEKENAQHDFTIGQGKFQSFCDKLVSWLPSVNL